MATYTSILLPLARSKKRLLEEAAKSRGASLESFVLEAAEAEAERISAWVMGKGHKIDHNVYSLPITEPVGETNEAQRGDQEVVLDRVAAELGRETALAEWQDAIDQLIDAVDALDQVSTPPDAVFFDGEGTRRGPRKPIVDVRLLNPVHGRVVDMSALGLGIETHRPFAVPERTTLSIGQAASAAKIRAEVRWCLLVRTERIQNGDIVPVYRSGLAFLEN